MTGTITEDRFNHKDQNTTGIHPIDSIFVQFDGSDEPATLPQEQGEGYPIKHTVIKRNIRRVYKDYQRQIWFSILRNVMCWMFLVSLIIIVSRSSELHSWPAGGAAAVAVCCGAGLLGVVAHVYRGYRDLTFQKPTLVALMLRDAICRDDLERIIQNRQLSPPEIFIEVSLKSGALAQTDPTHWTRRGRKTCKELPYRSWADQSPSLQHFEWPTSGASWILVTKDFRCVDELSKHMLESEVTEFRKETGFDSNRFFMDIEFVLQWKENDSCPDIEAYLVLDDVRSAIYSIELYRASWIMALDSVIRILFHFKTKHLRNYAVLKYIEK